ncbi:MAG: NAD(P)/FAD-dependent oxidoreductase [Lachnospiraceae bacterium]|nr:NAD(P)/FAD-dependent oxidoreductase [Lachnospiraceae bacterium]
MDSSKQNRKKIIIIGGGVAGLSAGIFAQKAGYDSVIYEKNGIAGGSLSGWYREGYAIDNCIHWFTGTEKGTMTNDLWRELGVIDDNTSIVKRDYFWASEYYGEVVHLWPDAEKTRAEMLRLAPKDADEINAFIDFACIANDAVSFAKNSPGEIVESINSVRKIIPPKEFLKKSIQYLGMTNITWAKRFKSPLLRSLILDFCPGEYEAYWLILSYSFYLAGNGDIIEGGSIKVANTLIENYKKAGGTLVTGCPVSKIKLSKAVYIPVISDKEYRETEDTDESNKILDRKVKGIYLENGEFVTADYYIVACDVNYAFNELIGKKYAPLSLKEIYKDHLKYTFYSAFQIAFAVESEFDEVPDSLTFPCSLIEVGFQKVKRIGVKNYRKYGDYIAPKGHTVIQVSIDQYEKDFRYWQRLYEKDPEDYARVKKNIALAVLGEIEKRFPKEEGRIRLLDVWTPYSYKKRNNDTYGSYMRFITTALSVNAFLPQDIKGISNVFLAGHWLKYPGGLPTAAQTGKDAVGLITAAEEKKDIVKDTIKKIVNEIIV